jgi:hypothetical protein
MARVSNFVWLRGIMRQNTIKSKETGIGVRKVKIITESGTEKVESG